MKIRLVVALVGLAIGFVVPALAQEKKPVDPEVRQQIEAVHMKFVEDQNKGDAVAIAALFTQDAVQVWYGLSEGGLASGQKDIEKRYRANFAAPSPLDSKIVQMYPIGNDIYAITEYKMMTWKGYEIRIYRPDADNRNIRMAYSNRDTPNSDTATQSN